MRAALIAGVAVLALAAPALAQSGGLPWKDANPLEGSAPKKAPPRKAAEAPVPKPEDRPKDETEAAKPAAAVPLPSAAPAERPADDKAEAPETAAPERAEPAAQPAPSGEDVPKPEARPKPPAEEAAPPTKDGAPPMPAEAPAPAEPPAPAEAPNSTEKLKAREPVIDPATAVVAAAAIEDAEACEAELKARGARFTVGESISEGECGVLRPVAIERLSSGVEVSPKTQILCRTALALDIWMSDSVVPAAKASFPGETVKTFQQASTYVCRPRASETGISEHSRGSAIDIGGFVFDKGRTIGVKAETAGTAQETFLGAIRRGACGPFKTVLGPGTDADHETHFHLDMAARQGGATYCK